MPSFDTYNAVAKQLKDYLDSFGLGFKTYTVEELNRMIQASGGEGARATTEEMYNAMLHRGLISYPKPSETQDGYVRIFRSGTLAANLLQVYLHPGPNGDAELSRLLRTLRSRRQPPSTSGEPDASDLD